MPRSTWNPACSSTWQYRSADFSSWRDSSAKDQMESATWETVAAWASMAAIAACFSVVMGISPFLTGGFRR